MKKLPIGIQSFEKSGKIPKNIILLTKLPFVETDYHLASAIVPMLQRGNALPGAPAPKTSILGNPFSGNWILTKRRTYHLIYPDRKVKNSLKRRILNELAQDVVVKNATENALVKAIAEKRPEDLKAIFHRFFASIPHDGYRKNQLSGYEGDYASIFYGYFAACGFDVRAEDATSHGRMDLRLFFDTPCYLFEFKVQDSAGEGRAMEPLKEKRYPEKYAALYQTTFLIGVEFSQEDRSIAGFEVERL